MALGTVLLAAFAVRAENVDLSTVPSRNTVQLTIYNSEDLTLVRETRKVTFKPGANPLQFSWANTLIDPTSVELRFLTSRDKLTVLDTTFPHAKPQMLYWNVQSEMDGEATIEITYFTSGISWSADYICIADPAEIDSGPRRLRAGEQQLRRRVRRRPGPARGRPDQSRAEDRRIGPHHAGEGARIGRGGSGTGSGRRPSGRRWSAGGAHGQGRAAVDPASRQEPKQVAKEGLSEYFIYTIEGTETIRNGWSKRMRSLEAAKVPLKIQYRYRPAEYGDQLVRMYLLTNDKDSKLGTTPLPDGVVRVFRENGRDGLSFLVAQPIKYIPIGDKIELNLGPDPEVIFELIKLRTWRRQHVDAAQRQRRVSARSTSRACRSR